MRFHDADPTVGFTLPPGIQPMTENDARRIVAFVRQHREPTSALLIHCEQGMSHSPAVGTAIPQALNLDTTPYDRDYQPNTYVRNLVLAAFATDRSRDEG